MKTADPTFFLPLTETTLYILVSLAGGPLHGYGIGRQVRSLSGNRIILSVSTLYTTLKRLLEDGLIERVGDEEGTEASGHPRKTYALTDLGRSVLAAEKQRLQTLLTVVKRETVGRGI